MGSKSLLPSVPERLDREKLVLKSKKLDDVYAKAKKQILQLKDEIQAGGGRSTPEQKEKMAQYMAILKQLGNQQEALQDSIERTNREEDLREQERKKRAMDIRQTKDPAPVYMYELRAMNQKVLTRDDVAARRAEAQKVKPVLASGGYTGYRVAPDLCKMDFNYFDVEKKDADLLWRGDGAVADIKARQKRQC